MGMADAGKIPRWARDLRPGDNDNGEYDGMIADELDRRAEEQRARDEELYP